METTLMEKCQALWQQLDITDPESLKKAISDIFKSKVTQGEVLAELYKLVLPEWEQIEKINGYPEVGPEFWKFVCRQFIEYDRKYHPSIFSGGIWLNNGFQSNSELDPWELSFDSCSVQYMAQTD